MICINKNKPKPISISPTLRYWMAERRRRIFIVAEDSDPWPVEVWSQVECTAPIDQRTSRNGLSCANPTRLSLGGTSSSHIRPHTNHLALWRGLDSVRGAYQCLPLHTWGARSVRGCNVGRAVKMAKILVRRFTICTSKFIWKVFGSFCIREW